MTTETLVRVDIGAGAKREDGWIAVDVVPYFKPGLLASVAALPFRDGSVDELRCWHVLEHLPKTDLIAVMNEMRRVLKPGGTAEIEVPVFPHWPAIADPTHVSFFVPQTFAYFCDEVNFGDYMRLYGIEPWNCASQGRHSDGQILRIVLEKPE